MANKNFMYGIGRVKFKDFVLGYIEKNSWNMNGVKPEVTKIEAEQKPGVPVLVIPQSNGSFSPGFNIIQLDYANLRALLGGSLHYKTEDTEKENPIGWTSPTAIITLSGPWQIDLVSGQSILIPDGVLLSNLGGNLTLTETAKVECSLEPQVPEDGSQACGVFNTDAIPTEWTSNHKLPPPETEEESEGT